MQWILSVCGADKLQTGLECHPLLLGFTLLSSLKTFDLIFFRISGHITGCLFLFFFSPRSHSQVENRCGTFFL